jgi:hypothetical protein
MDLKKVGVNKNISILMLFLIVCGLTQVLVFIESVIVKTGRGIQGRIQDLWLGGT